MFLIDPNPEDLFLLGCAIHVLVPHGNGVLGLDSDVAKLLVARSVKVICQIPTPDTC
jgi:hypothetical protein